jgi:hypothetical protein
VVLVWDNASWHVSREVRRWLGRHNREVKESGRGVRIVSCLLPKQSPWLSAFRIYKTTYAKVPRPADQRRAGGALRAGGRRLAPTTGLQRASASSPQRHFKWLGGGYQRSTKRVPLSRRSRVSDPAVRPCKGGCQTGSATCYRAAAPPRTKRDGDATPLLNRQGIVCSASLNRPRVSRTRRQRTQA